MNCERLFPRLSTERSQINAFSEALQHLHDADDDY